MEGTDPMPDYETTTAPGMSPQITYLDAPEFVWWDITYACNLSCKHCYSSSGRRSQDELSTAEARDLVSQLSAMRVCFIYFLGGEPFMRADLLGILEFCAASRVGVMISTNGWFVTADLARRLHDCGVHSVRVSVDGYRAETHDWFRGVQGSHRKAIGAIEHLVEAGIDVVGANMTITQRNIGELESLVRFLASIGVREMQCAPISETGRAAANADLFLAPEQHGRLASILQDVRAEVQPTMNLFAVDGLMDKPCTRCVGEGRVHPVLMGCGSGRYGCCIDPAGRILPCLLLREPVAGDLRKDSFASIWQHSPVFQESRRPKEDEACRECRYRSVCARECPRSESQRQVQPSDRRQRIGAVLASQEWGYRPCFSGPCGGS